MAEPLGVLLRNIGNVRKGPTAWEGEVRPGANETFCEFQNIEDGVRAVAKIMLTYFDKHQLKTVGTMIPRYAPSKENDVGAYVRSVCEMLQVRPSEELDLHNPSTLVLLVKGIIRQEVGYKDITKQLWADDYVIMKACQRATEAAKELRLNDPEEDENASPDKSARPTT